MSGRYQPREGDWTCPSCGKSVWGSKSECFACHAARPADAGQAAPARQSFQRGPRARPGDWSCQCGALCFASRNECFKCGTARPADAPAAPVTEQRFERRNNSRPGDWRCQCAVTPVINARPPNSSKVQHKGPQVTSAL